MLVLSENGQIAAPKRTERGQVERDEFLSALRTALVRLNDFPSLRRSPLLPRLLGAHGASPLQLQQRLLEAIEAVGQGGGPAQRAHEILYLRYVEQTGQSEVAAQLGVSVRQLRREQGNAIERLADVLAQRFPFAPASENQPGPAAQGAEPGRFVGASPLSDEFAWLRTQFTDETSTLAPSLAEALDHVSGLAQRRQVRLIQQLPAGLPTLAMPALVLRQLVTTLLTVALSRADLGALCVSARPADTGVVLALHGAHLPPVQPSADGEPHKSLAVMAQLLAEFGGEIRTERDDGATIEVTLPAVQSVRVLVVDDNPDTQQLFARYAQHSRFRVVATGDSEQAVALAQTVQPAALVVDIMMPRLDGWDLLARLRHHPRTAPIPVILCSVLPQAELAQLGGAADFLQKPVSQHAFLEALARVTVSSATAPG